jgi:hypothetical protein
MGGKDRGEDSLRFLTPAKVGDVASNDHEVRGLGIGQQVAEPLGLSMDVRKAKELDH